MRAHFRAVRTPTSSMAGDFMSQVTTRCVLRELKKRLLCAEERLPAQPELVRLPV